VQFIPNAVVGPILDILIVVALQKSRASVGDRIV
jgi:hypothetical protein